MILVGDNRVTIPTIERGSVQCIATSPPYFGLRLYGDDPAEIGKESDVGAYVQSIVDVMRLCRDALRDDGCAWVNLGDSYASTPAGNPGDDSKSTLVGGRGGAVNASQRSDTSHCAPQGNTLLIPFRVATALQADGWTLRAMVPWIKLASMPESVQSRPSMAHEYVLFLTKRPSGYFYDADAVRVANRPDSLEHFERHSPRRDAIAAANAKGLRATGAANHQNANGGLGVNPAGRSLRSSDFWRAGARSAAETLLAAADGEAIGLVTNDDAPAALIVNPKGSGIEHYAMWPVRLVVPMIRAGTPEAGSCSVCRAPWVRVVERDGGKQEQFGEKHSQSRKSTLSQHGHAGAGWYAHGTKRHQRGFRPSCAHVDAPTQPALVLDPFAGACTTLGVAEALGRASVGCELYQANADLMPRRIDVVRTEMLEILKAEGDERAADVELKRKEARHKGVRIAEPIVKPDDKRPQMALFDAKGDK